MITGTAFGRHLISEATVHHGDCIEVMRTLPDNSVDSIVTDPPYGLGFMGKAWDALPPGEDWARECLRVLKPGGHLLAFGGTRTWHRLAVAVEDAGFEIRDSIAWMYGSGFPKSLDVSKAIDKAAGADPLIVGPNPNGRATRVGHEGWRRPSDTDPNAGSKWITAPATPDAQLWQGWGTALKPAFEPVVVARKPLDKGSTVAANVLAHGTGALNIEASRIGAVLVERGRGGRKATGQSIYRLGMAAVGGGVGAGRWPANVILDEAMAEVLDGQSGITKDGTAVNRNRDADNLTSWYGTRRSAVGEDVGYGGSGGASRFFYVAKAPKRERPVVDDTAHPTVKPLALMQWLVRLVTPAGGTVLEPFAGSGTTVEACILEGFNCIAIEREAEYLPLIQARIDRAQQLTPTLV